MAWSEELVAKVCEISLLCAKAKPGSPKVGIDFATLEACIADAKEEGITMSEEQFDKDTKEEEYWNRVGCSIYVLLWSP